MTMSSSRPYLIRAFYEWIVDNNCTPYILVNATRDGVNVPEEHIKDGQIILNIAPAAVQNLLINNEMLEFDGRFSGVARPVFMPIEAVMGVYARENGQGMIFDAEGINPDPSDPGSTPDPSAGDGEGAAGKKGKKPAKKPALRVVK